MDNSSKITLDDLQGDQRVLAELIGIDSYMKMVEVFGGNTFYIWKKDSIFQSNRNKEICDKFDGYNFRELALEYNLSDRTIREIVADRLRAERSKPLENQMSFDELRKSSETAQ